MVETVAEWTAAGPDVTDDDRRLAREALDAIGAAEIVAALDMAEGIIRFGNCFHSVAAFFADGSAEQGYVVRLTSGDR